MFSVPVLVIVTSPHAQYDSPSLQITTHPETETDQPTWRAAQTAFRCNGRPPLNKPMKYRGKRSLNPKSIKSSLIFSICTLSREEYSSFYFQQSYRSLLKRFCCAQQRHEFQRGSASNDHFLIIFIWQHLSRVFMLEGGWLYRTRMQVWSANDGSERISFPMPLFPNWIDTNSISISMVNARCGIRRPWKGSWPWRTW